MNPFADTHNASVFIIGAGASGAVVALRLAQAGVDVLCLEQGSWPDRSSYRGSEVDFELSSGKQWSPDPTIRKGPGDYPVDYSACEIPLLTIMAWGEGPSSLGAQWVSQSMGRVGSCFDNAAAEAFFSTLEHEVLSRHHFTTKAHARQVVVAWCQDFYNTRRRHSSAA
jgi:choline dehydrogenase-like flavoprotein